MQHLESNEIFSKQQHGFRQTRSCETQLLEFCDEITANLASMTQTDVVIMDFQKAFDKVNHSLLIHKLNHYGVGDKCNKWIDNFLRNRNQSVVVEGTRSCSVSVQSGVPQGSVRGPCLFLVYINDLPARVTSTARLFADDTTINRKIMKIEDQNILQEDLREMQRWEEEWDMKFHPDKCSVLQIGRIHNILPPNYELHGQQLKRTSSELYLGVTIQGNGKWSKHIQNIYNKAKNTLSFLKRTLKIKVSKIKEQAYKAMVRPVLEYSSTVWDPYTAEEINQLESVQKAAARYVVGDYRRTTSITALLNRLKWPSLQKRRTAARLTMLYKIRHKKASVNTTRLRKPRDRPRRGHDQQYELIVYGKKN
ncbi:hypothetical protein ACOMHN_037992 [Nucella lapillus]